MDDDVPPNLKPTTRIDKLRFVICNSEDFDQLHPHLDYIAQKYTHLEERVINLEWMSSEGIEINEDSSELHIRIVEATAIMNSYLKTLAPRLKSFECQRVAAGYIRLPSFEWDLLDKAGCQIKRLSFNDYINSPSFELLSETTQAQYIQSLAIKMTMDDAQTDDEGDDEDSDEDSDESMRGIRWSQSRHYRYSLEWLDCFTALKELTIEFPTSKKYSNNQSLYVEQFFDILSEIQLEVLNLRNADLHFQSASRIHVYPSLRSLTLCSGGLDYGTDLFISQSFPNLKQLALDNCSGLTGTFMLPRLNLFHLRISAIFKAFLDRAPRHVLVITMDNNQQRLYTASETPFSVRRHAEDIEKSLIALSPASSEPYNGSMEMPYLSVVCGSLQEFSLLHGDL